MKDPGHVTYLTPAVLDGHVTLGARERRGEGLPRGPRHLQVLVGLGEEPGPHDVAQLGCEPPAGCAGHGAHHTHALQPHRSVGVQDQAWDHKGPVGEDEHGLIGRPIRDAPPEGLEQGLGVARVSAGHGESQVVPGMGSAAATSSAALPIWTGIHDTAPATSAAPSHLQRLDLGGRIPFCEPLQVLADFTRQLTRNGGRGSLVSRLRLVTL